MNEKKTYRSKAVSWSFDYGKEDQGLVLENVFDGEYHYANDIRTVLLYLEYEKSTYSSITGKVSSEVINLPIKLSTDYFDTVSEIELFEDTRTGIFDPLTATLGSFRKYPFCVGLRVVYNRITDIFTNADINKLKVTQSYLFSRYSKSPAHEPGGILPAARFFPLIKFELTKNKHYKTANEENPIDYKFLSIRSDYRFHLSLDVFLNYKGTSYMDESLALSKVSKQEEEYLKKKKPNQAALVRDGEVVPKSTSLEKLFASIEKPLQLEACAFGLMNSMSWPPPVYHGGGKVPRAKIHEVSYPTWDNIHWWGLAPGKKMLPSTPGAFHASHMHWRWSKIASTPDLVDKSIIILGNILNTQSLSSGAIGQDQFKGLHTGGGINVAPGYNSEDDVGGPLLDINVPSQTYRIAITTVDRSPLGQETHENYFKSFKDGVPSDISKGENLVLNLSIQANRQSSVNTDMLSGTLLIHGMYFAHGHDPVESDKISPFYNTIGKELNNGYRSKSKWFISPKDSLDMGLD